MITDYQIIFGTLQQVESDVRRAIERGWIPCGGIAVVHTSQTNETRWYQAMVLETING